MFNGSLVLYCRVVMKIIGKTGGGSLILQTPAGLQMIVRPESVAAL